jgi:hypothetical protein
MRVVVFVFLIPLLAACGSDPLGACVHRNSDGDLTWCQIFNDVAGSLGSSDLEQICELSGEPNGASEWSDKAECPAGAIIGCQGSGMGYDIVDWFYIAYSANQDEAELIAEQTATCMDQGGAVVMPAEE